VEAFQGRTKTSKAYVTSTPACGDAFALRSACTTALCPPAAASHRASYNTFVELSFASSICEAYDDNRIIIMRVIRVILGAGSSRVDAPFALKVL
jgi:hypothetical protein